MFQPFLRRFYTTPLQAHWIISRFFSFNYQFTRPTWVRPDQPPPRVLHKTLTLSSAKLITKTRIISACVEKKDVGILLIQETNQQRKLVRTRPRSLSLVCECVQKYTAKRFNARCGRYDTLPGYCYFFTCRLQSRRLMRWGAKGVPLM